MASTTRLSWRRLACVCVVGASVATLLGTRPAAAQVSYSTGPQENVLGDLFKLRSALNAFGVTYGVTEQSEVLGKWP